MSSLYINIIKEFRGSRGAIICLALLIILTTPILTYFIRHGLVPESFW